MPPIYCNIDLGKSASVSFGYERDRDYLVIFVSAGDPGSSDECCQFGIGAYALETVKPEKYLKEPVYYSRHTLRNDPSRYFGMLYLQITK